MQETDQQTKGLGKEHEVLYAARATLVPHSSGLLIRV